MLTGIDIKNSLINFEFVSNAMAPDSPISHFLCFPSYTGQQADAVFPAENHGGNRADRGGGKIKFFYFIRGKDPDAIPQGIRMELTIVKGAKGEMINDFRIIDKS